MRAVIQRVSGASVEIDGEIVSMIDAGILILLGVEEGDAAEGCHLQYCRKRQ